MLHGYFYSTNCTEVMGLGVFLALNTNYKETLLKDLDRFLSSFLGLY